MAGQHPVRRVGARPHVRRASIRAALAGAVALATLVVGFGPPAPAAAAKGTAADARARRTELLLRAAELTDRLETSEAGLVAAQLRQARTAEALSGLQARRRARAVTAYMYGTGASVAALQAPSAYLEVVAAKEKELLSGWRATASELSRQQDQAEAALVQLRAARADLAAVQAELDAVIAADDARRTEELRLADAARRTAAARQAAAVAAARSSGQLGVVTASPGGYAPTPLDPAALLPRHRAATARQIALMRSIPFGPLPAGFALPAGVVPTGQRIEGNASWYGPGFNGRPTASGAIYDQEAWTVASKELPLGSLLVVGRGDRRVLLLVNDRGPYIDGRVLDLSAAAARALGVGGVAPVVAEVVAAPQLRL